MKLIGKKSVRGNRARVLAAMTGLMIVPALAYGQSQDAGKGEDQWKFTMAPYLMVPWMDGTAALRGQEIKVNVAPSEIFSHLQFGAMGYFEARKSKWGIGADAVYMALGTTVDRPQANVDFNQGGYAFTAIREISSKVDFLAGARWNVLQGKFELKAPVQATVEQTKQWVDPIVGFKVKQSLGGRWQFSMQGDVGGFGAASKFAWQLLPMVGTNVGKRSTLGIGYRVLGMNYSSGSADKLFRYDVITQALVIGAAMHF
jgi:hypothetical protein